MKLGDDKSKAKSHYQHFQSQIHLNLNHLRQQKAHDIKTNGLFTLAISRTVAIARTNAIFAME